MAQAFSLHIELKSLCQQGLSMESLQSTKGESTKKGVLILKSTKNESNS